MSIARTQYNVFQQLTSVKVVSASNLSGVYLNGLLNNGVGATLTASGVGALVIDGVTLEQNDRVLLAAQTNANENGVYVVTNPGGVAAIWVLTRSADQQSIEQMKEGQFLPVSAGTANAGAVYVLVSPLPAHLGVDGLSFVSAAASGGGSFLEISANLSDVANAATARSNLGLGAASTRADGFFLQSANNLSDVPVAATARANLGAQSVANIKAAVSSDIGGAGAGPIAVSVPGLTISSVVVASVNTSSNPVSIVACIPGANAFNVVFSADPGAVCFINYVAFIAAQ